jgi:hypothetical protein
VRTLPGSATPIALAVAAALGGCGLDVQSPDLFLLTRTGQGPALTLLVNDGGTIRCDGGKARPLPDSLLIQARTLATDLNKDAKARLHLPPTRGSVARYTVKLQNGTVTFPDTAASQRHELAETELFALQGAKVCGLGG